MRARTQPTRRIPFAAALVATLALAPLPAALAAPAVAHERPSGAVFTLSNGGSGNAVLGFRRAADGSLSGPAAYPTGGLGTGADFGSQGAVTLTRDGRFLLAVDAGSDELTAFAVDGDSRLQRLNRVPSGGDLPISVDSRGGLVYVLNAGRSPNVTGLRLRDDGLHPIPHGTTDLSAGAAGPAQVGFTRGGDHLVVTLKGSNAIDTFRVRDSGRVAAPVTTPSVGATPFGFAVNRHGDVVVSNAEGGAPGASSTTSYAVNEDGTLAAHGPAVGTTQTAACWVVATRSGRFAYVTNTGSGSVSLYATAADGSLTLEQATAAADGGAPTDAAFSEADRFLYVLDSAGHALQGYRVARHDGELTLIGVTPGLTAGAVGLAAR